MSDANVPDSAFSAYLDHTRGLTRAEELAIEAQEEAIRRNNLDMALQNLDSSSNAQVLDFVRYHEELEDAVGALVKALVFNRNADNLLANLKLQLGRSDDLITKWFEE